MAAWFKRRRHCHLIFCKLKRPVSLGWGNGPLFVSGLVDWRRQYAAGSYFEFLMRRVAVAVIPRPAAATAASAIALGAVSPVFASLPAVVFACLPLLEFACLVELGGASLPVAGEATGGVASAGCVEPEGGVVSVGFRYLGRGGLVCRGLCLFVCLAGVVIGRLRLFQIAEERISLGCVPRRYRL